MLKAIRDLKARASAGPKVVKVELFSADIKIKAIRALKAMILDGPIDPYFGICYNLNQECAYGYKIVVEYARSWEHFSGDLDYPVPESHPFHSKYQKWSGKQLNYRRSLARHIILKLEVGLVATPYQAMPFGEELALCQRYYEKL
tara:strand:- start:5171 stop:5605 length:435 start_codon:yes stop_codon:yes gene_type:complete